MADSEDPKPWSPLSLFLLAYLIALVSSSIKIE